MNPWTTPTRSAPSRTGTAWALLLLLAAFFLIPLPAQAAPQDAVSLTLHEVAPSYVGPDDEITFSGEITNTGRGELTAITVWWRMRTPVLTTETLASWLAEEEDDIAPLTLARHDLPDPLPAGESVGFEMVIGLDNSPFDYGSANGPRGIELIVTATAADGETIRDHTRSTLIWYQEETPPVPLTVAVPLTATAAEWQEAITSATPVAQAAAPRLLAVLAELAEVDITWGVDSAVIDAIPPAQIEYVQPTDPADAQEDRTPVEWPPSEAAERLTTAIAEHTGTRPVIPLGWAAPDHQLLFRAGPQGQEIRDRNQAYAAEVLTTGGLPFVTDTAWSLTSLSLAAASHFATTHTTVLVPPTATGTLAVPPTATEVLVWSAKQSFTDLLTSEIPADELRARSLIHAQNDPHLLATLTGEITAVEATHLARNLAVLADVPWVDLGDLHRPELMTSGPVTPTASPLDPTQVTRVARALHRTDSLASITDAPERFAAAANTTAFAALTQAWQEAATPQSLIDTLTRVAEGEYLRIAQPSTVNLISQGGDLPVGIESTATIPLYPTVVVEPDDPRLQVEAAVPAALTPASSTTVVVPITAVANGNVTATIRLLDGGGEEVAQPQTFTVRVRADWETTGTAVIAGLVAAGFVFGLYRNMRAARRKGQEV